MMKKLDFAFAVSAMALLLGCGSFDRDPLLAYYQTFDDAALKDATGQWSDGVLAAGKIVPGKVGNALHVDANKKGAKVPMLEGVLGKKGCIEFWAKLDNGDGLIPSICSPVFFSVNAGDAGRLALGWSTNFGHGDSGLTFHYWGVAFSSSHKDCLSHPYSSVLKSDPAGWHHYAVVWNYDSSDAEYAGAPLVVYIDGVERYAAGKPGTKRGPAEPPDWQKLPKTLEFSFSEKSRSGYLIDEFKIWTTDRRAFAL